MPLTPLETLDDGGVGPGVPLPQELARLYGRLSLPSGGMRPYVFVNFVATLDGVTSLGLPGRSGGGPISGNNQHDRMVMGLLRAVADAVVVGAGTLRAVPKHVWTPAHAYPPLEREYRELRASLGKRRHPLNVIVTASGTIDLALPVFHQDGLSVMVLTTERGGDRLSRSALPPSVDIIALTDRDTLDAGMIVDAVASAVNAETILLEGGPSLLGGFFASERVDELFLTLAPQVAGRDGIENRPGLVAGRNLAPDSPAWGRLIGVKRAGDHLFLRYAFPAQR